jgi:D-alanine-D-alanine ligase
MGIDVDPEWWKSLFDDVYLVTDARSVGDENLTRREVDVLCEMLPLHKDDRILDLCGGQGRHSMELLGRGFGDCTVLDYSDVLIERGKSAAAERGVEVSFVQGNASATGLPEKSFDHVLILGNSLGYLPRPEDDVQIMKEALRLLRPGGWVLLDVTDGSVMRRKFNPNAWHEIAGDIVVCRERELGKDSIRAREVVISKERGLVRERTYAIRTYGPDGLTELVRKAGFEEVSVRRGFSSREAQGDYGFMDHRLITTARKRPL